MVGINVFAAETDREAERLATSHLQAHLQLAQGRPIELPPPVNRLEEVWNGRLDDLPFLRSSIIGGPSTVEARLRSLAEATQADEVMIHSMIFDHAARRRSYEIVRQVAGGKRFHDCLAARARGKAVGPVNRRCLFFSKDSKLQVLI